MKNSNLCNNLSKNLISLVFCLDILIVQISQVRGVTLPDYCKGSSSSACNVTEYELVNKNCREIRRLLAQYHSNNNIYHEEESSPFTCFDDILLTLSQSNQLLETVKLLTNKKENENIIRKKRAGIVKNTGSIKWTSPIKYKVDNSISMQPDNLKAVRAAVQTWTSGTCLTFEEISYDLNITEPHLLFTYLIYPTCSSYIGITPGVVPQPIYLGFLCYSMGIVAHELAHALGLIHEHQRPDRDQYINIIPDNMLDQSLSLFDIFNGSAIQTFGMPYDYGSDMQYRGTAYSKNGKPTIQAKDLLYQNNMGQREEVSFYDFYAMNQEYCSEQCNGQTLAQPCSNMGYQDPKNCSRCRCPDGWAGAFCDQVASSVNATCGGVRQASNSPSVEYFPSQFGDQKIYQTGQECSWLLQGEPNTRIALRFTGTFSVACSSSEGGRCLHWVEVHYGENLGLTGPRFCCNTTYSELIVSVTNRMLITFKAITDGVPEDQRRGFGFYFYQVDANGPIVDITISNAPNISSTLPASSSFKTQGLTPGLTQGLTQGLSVSDGLKSTDGLSAAQTQQSSPMEAQNSHSTDKSQATAKVTVDYSSTGVKFWVSSTAHLVSFFSVMCSIVFSLS